MVSIAILSTISICFLFNLLIPSIELLATNCSILFCLLTFQTCLEFCVNYTRLHLESQNRFGILKKGLEFENGFGIMFRIKSFLLRISNFYAT